MAPQGLQQRIVVTGLPAFAGNDAAFVSASEQGYSAGMTKLLDKALEAVRVLPPDAQDDIARVVLQLAGGDAERATLSPDERAAIDKSKAAAARGEFATDEQVRAVWAKHGL